MHKTAVALLIAAAFAFSASLASADELAAIADGNGWGVTLYADEEESGAFPGGGLAFSMRPRHGWPDAVLALDYASEDAPLTEGSGLGLRASLDLLQPGGEVLGAEPSLRLSYRMASGFDPVGGSDEAAQIVALRAGFRW